MWVRTSVHPTSGQNFLQSDAHKLTAHLPPNTVLKLQSTTTRQDRSWRGNVLILHKEEAEKEERTGVSGECWHQWAVDLDSNTETILWQMSSKAIWLFEHIHARKKKRSDPVVKLAWVTSRCWWTNNRTTTNTQIKKKIWCDSNVLEFSLLRWLSRSPEEVTEENFLRFERRWKHVWWRKYATRRDTQQDRVVYSHFDAETFHVTSLWLLSWQHTRQPIAERAPAAAGAR